MNEKIVKQFLLPWLKCHCVKGVLFPPQKTVYLFIIYMEVLSRLAAKLAKEAVNGELVLLRKAAHLPFSSAPIRQVVSVR